MIATAPIEVTGEVVGLRHSGAYHQLTLVAPGVPERFRPGSFLTLSRRGELSTSWLPSSLPISRSRTNAYGGTVELVFDGTDAGTRWLSRVGAGDRLAVVGPLGRTFTLPREPVVCTLVGSGEGSASLIPLAELLRDRGCTVHMVLTAASEQRLFGALEAKRVARTVLLSTGDLAEVLSGLVARTRTDVLYACGPMATLRTVARVADDEGVWSQTALLTPMPCGTGICHGCVLRACVDGPVFHGNPLR